MRCVAFARHALVFVLPVRGRGDRLQADMRGDCMADWISVLRAFLERSCWLVLWRYQSLVVF